MKNLTVGMLAHVDAGKTTLSEGILYKTGSIKEAGRVDKKNTHLDTYELERARGITIFSKQALFKIGDFNITLIDTPGHMDFSAEMERTLGILDYAVLVVSGVDKVHSHGKAIWKLLSKYRVPCFIFVNKMDYENASENKIWEDIKKNFGDNIINFSLDEKLIYEEIATCSEKALEEFLSLGKIEKEHISELIYKREIFPCIFGSALKLKGVDNLLNCMEKYLKHNIEKENFQGRIYKITRDNKGNRLAHIKIAAGELKVKDTLVTGSYTEKINEIRIYSGERYVNKKKVVQGEVCAVTGLKSAKAGAFLFKESDIDEEKDYIEMDMKKEYESFMEPVLSYKIVPKDGKESKEILPYLEIIEDENPEIKIEWNNESREISVSLMGEIQKEILANLLKSGFDISVGFGDGSIIYRETINNKVEGVGHFEPLRHYAEVHLLMEKSQSGEGIKIENICSTDLLNKNWQNQIIDCLRNKTHRGVLTGSPITDIKITLISGKAHVSHTEGGDFREAAERAVRQGLMEAESILLEPYYFFELELPENMVGKAMTDVAQMNGKCFITESVDGVSVISGSAPVIKMKNYHGELLSYTKGAGKLHLTLDGYRPCKEQDAIIEMLGYDPETDIENPTGSIFCKNGAGYYVKWDEVKSHMHLERYQEDIKEDDRFKDHAGREANYHDDYISLEEIERIFSRTFYANRSNKSKWRKNSRKTEPDYSEKYKIKKRKESSLEKESYLLIDGYNLIHAWDDTSELAGENMDGARERLLEIIANYSFYTKEKIIIVFDAYRTANPSEKIIEYEEFKVIFTKEAQTADQYIEKFTYDNKEKFNMRVVTSDRMQQLMALGNGAAVISAREFFEKILEAREKMREEYGIKSE